MTEGWERVGEPPSRLRWVGMPLLVTPIDPDGATQVLRFVIGGEPLDPAEVAPDAAAPATPEPEITPRP